MKYLLAIGFAVILIALTSALGQKLDYIEWQKRERDGRKKNERP